MWKHSTIQVSPFLVEAGAHVVDCGLEAGVEDGVVEGVGRGGEQGAQQAQGVTHTDVAGKSFHILFTSKILASILLHTPLNLISEISTSFPCIIYII